jgi:hypothetical protein
MMIATQKIDVTDTYQDPRTLAEASIRFYCATDGRLVVKLSWAVDVPNHAFPATIEAARETWKAGVARLAREGYTVRRRRNLKTG